MSKLFCFMGVSGSGKSTIQHSLPISFLTNYTTRELRVGETDGYHINKVSEDNFKALVNDNLILEWTKYAGEFYGTPAYVKGELEKGKSFHSTKDINGVQTLKEKLGEDKVVAIYIKPPSLSETIRRMEARGDTREGIKSRLRQLLDTDELENEKFADYIIDNKDLDRAIFHAHKIVINELAN